MNYTSILTKMLNKIGVAKFDRFTKRRECPMSGMSRLDAFRIGDLIITELGATPV